MITLTSVLFPIIAIGCSLWIVYAMVDYLAEIRKDIRDLKR